MKIAEPNAAAWNADLYEAKHNFVFDLARDLVSVLDPRPGERILDVGCGTGQLTELIREHMEENHNAFAEQMVGGTNVRRFVGRHESITAMPGPPVANVTAGTIVGIDPSETMIANARENYPNISFQVMNVTAMTFENEFDAIFSNAVLHWIPNADLVISSMSRALKLGGRLVVEFGGKGNVAGIVDATLDAFRAEGVADIHMAWLFPSIGEYTPILERHGFEVQSAVLVDRPTKLHGESGLADWFKMFSSGFVGTMTSEQRTRAFERAAERLRSTHYHETAWWADYRRLRIVAVKAR
jgi:trans-aconitate methyltransferase